MAGPWEDFAPSQPQAQEVGPWTDFAPKPKPMGKDANADFLKAELANADWGTRNIASLGTALSDAWEGAKQLVGKGDIDRIRDNKIIQQSAPAGAITGNVLMSAVPFAQAGNGINAAAKIGTVLGALNPVDSENTRDIVAGKILGAATGGATAAAGQGLANAVGSFFERRAAAQAIKQATNAPIDQTIRDAADLGYKVSPSSVNGSWFNALREGAGGKIATAHDMAVNNAGVSDAVARELLHLPADAPITSEAAQALRRSLYDSGYAPLARMGEMPVSEEYGKALDGLISGRSEAARSFPGADSPDLRALVESYKPQGDKWQPAAVRDDIVSRLQSLVGDREASRIGALQERGKLQTAAAEAETRANNFFPVPGMPRVPARLSNNLDRANEYSAAAPEVSNIIAKRAAQRDGLASTADALSGLKLHSASFDAGDAIQATRVLRDEAKAAFRQGDNATGRTKIGISNEIENEIERQLASKGESGAQALQKFKDARKQMAISHDVEDAIIEGGGTVDARVWGRKLQNGEPLSDKLRVAAAFANNFPKAVQPLKNIAGPGVSKLDIAMALAGGATGYSTEGGAGGVAGTLLPIALSKAARMQMMSKGAQNALQRTYGLTTPQVAANRLAQYLPVGGAVLGRNALAQYLAP